MSSCRQSRTRQSHTGAGFGFERSRCRGDQLQRQAFDRKRSQVVGLGDLDAEATRDGRNVRGTAVVDLLEERHERADELEAVSIGLDDQHARPCAADTVVVTLAGRLAQHHRRLGPVRLAAHP